MFIQNHPAYSLYNLPRGSSRSVPSGLMDYPFRPSCLERDHVIPFRSVPFHSVPFRSVPFRSIPFRFDSWNSVPFHLFLWTLLTGRISLPHYFHMRYIEHYHNLSVSHLLLLTKCYVLRFKTCSRTRVPLLTKMSPYLVIGYVEHSSSNEHTGHHTE